MRQLLTKCLLVLLILSLFLHLTGCTIPEYISETTPPTDPADAYKEDPVSYVVFTRSTGTKETYVLITDLMEYTSKYADCNGTWFRDRLEGEDLCIYQAYLFAMENGCTGFEMYVEDADRDFNHIRQAVSLDSPFMAQNYDNSERVWSQPPNYLGERILVHLEQFTASRWENNMQALEKCREIVAGIPATCVTQEEKAEYLYRYVCDNVEYVSYDQVGRDDYLYDAVIEGKTFCDGYSNMLNMLFNLAGITSCEAMGSNIENIDEATEEELEEYSGHTWVVGILDGHFYNFDPTFDDTVEYDKGDDLWYFGFSDDLLSTKYLDLDEMRPKCTDKTRDFNYADLIVTDVTHNPTVKSIAVLAESKAAEGQYTILVGVQAVVEDYEYDLFFDYVKWYVNTIDYIEIVHYDLQNATLWELTVET